MKFLVLALCVCAASAASFQGKVGFKPWQPVNTAKAFAQVSQVAVPVVKPVYEPEVQVAKYVAPQVKNVNVVGHDVEATIVRSDSEVKPDGYNYVFETSNGIAASSSGTLKKVDNVDVLTVQGQYQYQSPEGIPVQFTYVADENGYQPKSDLLPVGPPIPEAILRSLQYIAAHPQKEEVVRKF